MSPTRTLHQGQPGCCVKFPGARFVRSHWWKKRQTHNPQNPCLLIVRSPELCLANPVPRPSHSGNTQGLTWKSTMHLGLFLPSYNCVTGLSSQEPSANLCPIPRDDACPSQRRPRWDWTWKRPPSIVAVQLHFHTSLSRRIPLNFDRETDVVRLVVEPNTQTSPVSRLLVPEKPAARQSRQQLGYRSPRRPLPSDLDNPWDDSQTGLQGDQIVMKPNRDALIGLPVSM